MSPGGRKRWLRGYELVLVAVVFLHGCGSGGSGGDSTPPPRLASISVSPDTVTLEAIDATAQLGATARDTSGNTMAAVFSWNSADPTVVTVSADGLVTSRDNGMTTVTVTSGSVTASVPVTVEQRVADLVTVSDSVTMDALGTTVQLDATAQDANGHEVSAEFRWSSSDDLVATVDAGGLVTANGNGTAVVTVTSGAFSAPVTVTVSLVPLYPGIVLTPARVLLEAFDATLQLQADVFDADGNPVSAELSWASSDPSVATVDATGRVVARRNGVSEITADTGDLSGSSRVTVEQRIRGMDAQPPTSPSDPVRFASIGETVQFSVQATDFNGHLIDGITFAGRSSDPDIVAIDENLLATAIGNGRTIIAFVSSREETIFGGVAVRQAAHTIDIQPHSMTLIEPNQTHQFVANVKDANGHPLPAEFISWGSVDRRVADVDGNGLVTVRGNGETDIRILTQEGATASATVRAQLEVTCEAGPRNPIITGIETAPLVEGASFTVRGAGFCGDASGNLVTVDGTVADIAAASESALTAIVPQFDCLPARSVALTVTAGAERAIRAVRLRPDEPVISMPVGQQVVLDANAEECIQFAESAESEAYLVGVQSTVLTTTREVTNVRLIATTASAESAPAISLRNRRTAWNIVPHNSPTSVSSFTHSMTVGTDEQEFVDSVPVDTALSTDIGVPAATGKIEFPRYGDVETIPELGDIVTLPGSSFDWLVYRIGTHALWLVNMSEFEVIDGKYSGRIEELSNSFDRDIYPAVVDYFGVPELGRLGRVVISIPGEFGGAYQVGNAGRVWTMIQIAVLHSRSTLAHELTHVVQASVLWRGQVSRADAPRWFREGQAQLGSEIFGLAVSNRHSGQNYGASVAREQRFPGDRAWGLNFHFIGNFFGGDHPERPQECSWFVGDPTPCDGYQLYYAVGWSLLRWLTDQYGRSYPGGERELHRELMREPAEYAETIERLLEEPMGTLLARWAAALYVDDRIANVDPTLQFTSWNFWDIYRDDPERLMPLEITFSTQEQTARIRDGSIWYMRVAGDRRPATAFRVRDRIDGLLPDEIMVWVVRLQ